MSYFATLCIHILIAHNLIYSWAETCLHSFLLWDNWLCAFIFIIKLLLIYVKKIILCKKKKSWNLFASLALIMLKNMFLYTAKPTIKPTKKPTIKPTQMPTGWLLLHWIYYCTLFQLVKYDSNKCKFISIVVGN